MARPRGEIKEARDRGETRYSTGEPCLHGHIAERMTSNQRCVQCLKEGRRGKRRDEGKAYYKKNRDKVLLWAHSWKLKSRYGITPEEHAAMMERQGGVCAICGTSERSERNGNRLRFCLDHDHKTGKPRGFLCNSCNAGIGQLRDDPTLLRSALAYLEKHGESQ